MISRKITRKYLFRIDSYVTNNLSAIMVKIRRLWTIGSNTNTYYYQLPIHIINLMQIIFTFTCDKWKFRDSIRAHIQQNKNVLSMLNGVSSLSFCKWKISNSSKDRKIVAIPKIYQKIFALKLFLTFFSSGKYLTIFEEVPLNDV